MTLIREDILRATLFLIYHQRKINRASRDSKVYPKVIKNNLKGEEGFFPYKPTKINLLTEKELPPYHEKETTSFNNEIISYLIKFSQEIETPIEREDISKILEFHGEYHGDLNETGRKQPKYPRFFTKVIWGLDGLQIQYNKIPIKLTHKFEDIQLYRFLELCHECRGDVAQACLTIARESEISLERPFIIKLWKHYKLIDSEKKRGVSFQERLLEKIV